MGEFEALQAQGWLWAYLGVFAAGIVTSLTPCVYPMIPIVLGIFGAKDTSRLKAFGLATLYVTGMGVTFATLGVAAALAGKQFGTALSNPWFVIPIVIFYAVLATSMFGAFDLNLPASWQERLNRVGGRGWGGAFAMGMVGGLTAAPCTGPMLAGILAFVATTQSVTLGFSLLFTHALGIGVLFWVLAVFAAAALPKSGRWMEGVKSVAGIALLVMGGYFLRPIWPALQRLPSPSREFLFGALGLAIVGIAIGGIHLSFHDAWKLRLRKGAGVALTVAGSLGVVLWFLTPSGEPQWAKQPTAAIDEAKAAGKPVLIDFGANWCAPCLIYETKVFADPVVRFELDARFVAVRYDLSRIEPEEEAAQERFRAQTLPAVILLDSQGNEAGRFTEPIPSPDEFAAALKAVK